MAKKRKINKPLNHPKWGKKDAVKEIKEKSTKELFYCPASKQKGKCGNCNACYNPKIETIAYLEH